MSRWGVNRNLVPGHHRGIKRGGKARKTLPFRFGSWETNPGYDISDDSFWSGRSKRQAHARWYKPFQSKPIKRRDKRGQSKPR